MIFKGLIMTCKREKRFYESRLENHTPLRTKIIRGLITHKGGETQKWNDGDVIEIFFSPFRLRSLPLDFPIRPPFFSSSFPISNPVECLVKQGTRITQRWLNFFPFIELVMWRKEIFQINNGILLIRIVNKEIFVEFNKFRLLRVRITFFLWKIFRAYYAWFIWVFFCIIKNAVKPCLKNAGAHQSSAPFSYMCWKEGLNDIINNCQEINFFFVKFIKKGFFFIAPFFTEIQSLRAKWNARN